MLPTAFSDELHLRSGGTFSGKLIEQSADCVKFEVTEGAGKAVLTVPKSQLRGITANGQYTAFGEAEAPAAPKSGDAGPEDAGKTEKEAAQPKPPEDNAARYKDGEYTGKGKGHKGEIVVSVKIKEGKIAAVDVTKHRDDPKYYPRGVTVIKRIIEKQDTKGVDVVTKATHTSRGILDATSEALKTARNDSVQTQQR